MELAYSREYPASANSISPAVRQYYSSRAGYQRHLLDVTWSVYSSINRRGAFWRATTRSPCSAVTSRDVQLSQMKIVETFPGIKHTFLWSKNKVNPFSTWRLHAAWMYIWWVCTRAACKENPDPNPNSHDHCLLSKWKCRTCAHTHYSFVQLDNRHVEKRIYLLLWLRI